MDDDQDGLHGFLANSGVQYTIRERLATVADQLSGESGLFKPGMKRCITFMVW